ncbi:MAG: hypothetical protein WCK32_10225 [Chlorobiaceae bacterium]
MIPFRKVILPQSRPSVLFNCRNYGSEPSIHPNAAVVDIGSRFHVAAVPLDRTDEPVKTFKSFTGEIHSMALCFKSCRIDTITMESTGVYWIPAFEILSYCSGN